MLHINGLTYRIGGRLLLEDASVAVPDGHKVGIVGRNGVGKSTLFRLILGELQSESGARNAAAQRQDRHRGAGGAGRTRKPARHRHGG